MKVDILASGSKGNCIAIQTGETTILIDAGIAKTKIEKRLLDVGIRADEIAAIFVTHAHKDHICGLPLANKYRIPVFASEGEWKDIKTVDDELREVMVVGETVSFGLGAIDVHCFNTHHDAYAPLGYTIYHSEANKQCSICLDTGKIDSEMLEAMKDSNIYIIEANHDPEMVEASDYPLSVQARVLSDIGHLSNQQTAEALSKLVKGRGEKIYLTHLSSSNNLPMLAEMTVIRALRKKGFEAGKHYEIEVV
jgi:phosphoribosyl 1,2-cyclic phosphodiesterase